MWTRPKLARVRREAQDPDRSPRARPRQLAPERRAALDALLNAAPVARGLLDAIAATGRGVRSRVRDQVALDVVPKAWRTRGLRGGGRVWRVRHERGLSFAVRDALRAGRLCDSDFLIGPPARLSTAGVTCWRWQWHAVTVLTGRVHL